MAAYQIGSLCHSPGQYQQALKLGSSLLYELKKLDDKALLVEVQLIESKVYHSLGNLPKAKLVYILVYYDGVIYWLNCN